MEQNIENGMIVIEKEIKKENRGLLPKLKENYQFFGGASSLYGVLYVFCLYNNYFGITFPLLVAATIIIAIYCMKKLGIKINKLMWFYACSAILLGISSMLTTNNFFQFFNIIGIVLLILVMMIQQFYDDSTWKPTSYLYNIVLIVFRSVSFCLYPFKHLSSYIKTNNNKNHRIIKSILIGILISIPLLILIGILLLSADRIFFMLIRKFVVDIFGSFNIISMMLMFMFAYIAFYSCLCSLSYKDLSRQKKKEAFTADALIAITFCSVISIIYLVFCSIQVIYLFSAKIGNLPDGFTYAEYARKGFFELLFVCIINLAVVLICLAKFNSNKILKGILTIISLCTFIMIASSAYRMILYIREYNLTFLRILVLWFLALLTFLMAGLFVYIFNHKFPFFKLSIVTVTILYLVFSFMKPDYLIAKYNIENTETMNYDTFYHLLSLSYDAAPAIANINTDLDSVEEAEWYFRKEGSPETHYQEILECYFTEIKKEYNNNSIRQFNYSKWKSLKAAEIFLK